MAPPGSRPPRGDGHRGFGHWYPVDMIPYEMICSARDRCSGARQISPFQLVFIMRRGRPNGRSADRKAETVQNFGIDELQFPSRTKAHRADIQTSVAQGSNRKFDSPPLRLPIRPPPFRQETLFPQARQPATRVNFGLKAAQSADSSDRAVGGWHCLPYPEDSDSALAIYGSPGSDPNSGGGTL